MKKTLIVLSLCTLMAINSSAASDVNSTSATASSSQPLVGLGDKIFPNEGNPNIDIQNYDLNITWDDKSGNIKATTTIQMISTENIAQFSLDFHKLNIDTITLDNKAVKFSRKQDKLTIVANEPLTKNKNFTLVVQYHGVPDPVKGTVAGGWEKRGDGISTMSEPISAKNWYPCNNHPLDKATYSFHITVPKTFTVVANGKPEPTTFDGESATYTFKPKAPITTYSTIVHIGHFEEQKLQSKTGVPIYNYFEKGVKAEDKKVFAKQAEILEYYAGIFGSYPFETSGVIVMNGKSALAYETQTRATFGVPTGETKFAHELAHQWFGDSVSLTDWKETWLKEGFATYASALWLSRKDPKIMEALMKSSFESMMGIQSYPKKGLKDLLSFFQIKERTMSKKEIEQLIVLGMNGKTNQKELKKALALVPKKGLSNYKLDEVLAVPSFPYFHLTRRQGVAFTSIISGKKPPKSKFSFEDFVAILAKAPREVETLDDIYGGGTYTRGALALHALHLKVGDETFFKILKTYMDTYKNANASSDDFIAIAKKVSGKNLDTLFNTWLEDKMIPDMPEYGLYVKDYKN